jgi:hypothetical protein
MGYPMEKSKEIISGHTGTHRARIAYYFRSKQKTKWDLGESTRLYLASDE